jgi:hypothetical protein
VLEHLLLFGEDSQRRAGGDFDRLGHASDYRTGDWVVGVRLSDPEPGKSRARKSERVSPISLDREIFGSRSA